MKIKNDSINANIGNSVQINVLLNDSDPQNDINNSTVHLVNGIDTTGNGIHDTYHVEHEGIWTVNQAGIVSFSPEDKFTKDPTIIQYTVRNLKGNTSQPATISI